MTTSEDSGLEALERAVAEIEVLESIYGCCDADEGDTRSDTDPSSMAAFRVVSMNALESARSILLESKEISVRGDNSSRHSSIPRLDVVIQLPLVLVDGVHDDSLIKSQTSNITTCLLRCGMPPGYPISYPIIVSVDIPNLPRSVQDKLSEKLRMEAQQLVGEEAVLTLAQKLQEIGSEAVHNRAQATKRDKQKDTEVSTIPAPTGTNPTANTTLVLFSRQWLFMDHIKAERRRAQMMDEARDHQVGGYIKPGYPGICVLEGEQEHVNDYVTWIKSIWIGRVAVRGQVTLECGGGANNNHHQQNQQLIVVDELRKLPKELTDLGNGKQLPNMGVLASVCRTAGLETEFLEYIMQIVR